jgi:hypothetical protein
MNLSTKNSFHRHQGLLTLLRARPPGAEAWVAEQAAKILADKTAAVAASTAAPPPTATYLQNAKSLTPARTT